MSAMSRRGFLRRLAGAIVGLTLARELPGIAAAPPKLLLPPVVTTDAEVGIAIRFVRHFDVASSRNITRLDVFCGTPI
ncbi:MAG: hypothetical protein ACRD3C_22625 [Vicinamibacterales bacterium]